jgi:hypothetical protein
VFVDRIGADKQRQENLLAFSNIAHCLQVVVDRIGADKQRQENLFEFNLQKSGVEKEQVMGDASDR